MGQGKGGGYQQAPPIIQQPTQPDYTPMLQMMQTMMQSVQEIPQPAPIIIPQMPQMPSLPPIYTADAFSATAAEDMAAVEAMNELFSEGRTKKGRLDTILTSPLLDEEDAETTRSLLGGADVNA